MVVEPDFVLSYVLVAVMVAVPVALAVTLPSESTAATFGLLLDHETVVSGLFSPATVTDNDFVSPAVNCANDGVTVTESIVGVEEPPDVAA